MRAQGAAGFLIGSLLTALAFRAIEIDRGDPKCWGETMYVRQVNGCIPSNAMVPAR